MRFVVVALVLCLGYVVLYASAVKLSKDRVVSELIRAVDSGDMAAIESRVDFRALRAFVKKDLRSQSTAAQDVTLYNGETGVADQAVVVDDYNTVNGAIVSVAGDVEAQDEDESDLNAIVDYYVSEDRLALALDLRRRIFGQAETRDFVWDVSFHGPFAFVVTVGYPRTEGLAPTMSEMRSSVEFVFKANGWKWEAKEMYVPLFLVPKDIYTEEQIEELLFPRAP